MKPPEAPPKALPSVPVKISTSPSRPKCSAVPLPFLPTKPVAWQSSIIIKASYFFANETILSSFAYEPSIEKTPSLTITL